MEHTLTAYCMSCASVQTCLVCVQYITHRCFFHFGSQEPALTRMSIRILSPSTLSLSLTAGVTTVFACCRFSASTTLSQCLLSGMYPIRDVLPYNSPFLHDQRLTKITERSHHRVLRLNVLVHDFFKPFQLRSGASRHEVISTHNDHYPSLSRVERTWKRNSTLALVFLQYLAILILPVCGCIASAVQSHSEPPIRKTSFAPHLGWQLDICLFFAWSVTVRSADV